MGFSPSNKHGTTTSIFSNIVDAATGSFVDSLTVSGVAVVTGTVGGGGGGLNNVVEDTTPELGGNLGALLNDISNVNSFESRIVTVTGGGTDSASSPSIVLKGSAGETNTGLETFPRSTWGQIL
jgi:hypothetical protein